MNSLAALTIILVVFAVGDMLAVRTKSIISMLFFASAFFIVAFWLGLPPTIFGDSTLLAIGQVLITMLLVHMGTMLNIRQLKEQWKTVIVAVLAIIGVAVGILVLGSPIVGIETALVSAPPVSGGVIAGIQMAEAATALGREDLAVLASLLVVVQGFVGYPLASLFLKKEAVRIQGQYRAGALSQKVDADPTQEKEKKSLFPKLPAAYESANYFLAKTALVALLATFVSGVINESVGFRLMDANIMALLLGIIFSEIGFLEKEILIKSNSFGISMAALTSVILSTLSAATPDVLRSLLLSILIALAFGTVGILLFSFIASKIFKMSIWMAFGIGISALFGFPGTFIVSQEVADSVGQDLEERNAILDHILPKMLVSGFVTVSIGSVVLAGIAASFLSAL
ncbi:hypothetical protein [Atopococcus tabaci]|uniref:hypothetical protein n=1 Tax=Atopococcus tabaci TaxID=269774 RepID=UPI002409F1D8|nr:hypothetical protein [Atopococcus tabaci]